MVGVRTTGVARRLAESFVAVSSASEGVFLYYKFGRHEGVFSEKPYFLLSHCAHVLFTLWRFEEEESGDLFRGEPRPTAFLSGLNFGSLRYNDYKRRMLHADSFEDHWRNETQWFEFWMQILEHYDPSGVAVYQEFSRCILAWATQGDVLERKAIYKTQAAFDRFMKTDAAGSVMLRTLSVLDEVMRGVVQCLAGLDPSTCLLERITALTGLLNEIRRIVIYQTPAKGPYTPLGATRWRAPSPLGRLFWGRPQGILTVVPRREGGDIICTYCPTSQPKDRRRSWTRALSSFAGPYEQELFATWPYGTGECRNDPSHPSDVTARWTLQNEEAGRLETLSRRIDALLDGLARHPPCARLVEEVKSVSRNGNARWKAADLPWTYIRRLDELLGKLKLIYREANVLGGGAGAEKIIAGVSPAPQTEATGQEDAPIREEPAGKNDVVEIEQAGADQPAIVEPPQLPEPSERGIGTDEAQSAITQAIEELSAICLSIQDQPAALVTSDSSLRQEPGKTVSPCDVSASAWCAERLPTKRTRSAKKPRTGIAAAVRVADEGSPTQADCHAQVESGAGDMRPHESKPAGGTKSSSQTSAPRSPARTRKKKAQPSPSKAAVAPMGPETESDAQVSAALAWPKQTYSA